ncbi:MAG: bestrophin family ion channel [Flavobacteriaceae bacterium]
MYIGKRYPFFGVIKWSKKYLFYFVVIDSIPVLLYKYMGYTWLAIPWQPIALIGIAVSFYLGFKNNSSYDRLWEARKIWGGIVNASRTFTIMSRDFITNEFSKEKLSEEELHEIHKTVIHRHVAWLKALTYQLRIPKPWEHSAKLDDALRKMGGVYHEDSHFDQLKPYISEAEFEYVMSKGNVASHLISIQSKALLALKLNKQIEDFRHMELEKMLGEFYSLQGKSERIKNFPFPRQYATVNYIFVWIFIFLLPFGMLNIFGDFNHSYSALFSIPFTMLVSWVFILMEMIGEYSENPFEGLYNDVPITTMARSIEIDIRQMLDETDLPKPIEPTGEHNIML